MKRLITTVLGLYKKALPDQYHLITQGICRILESICMDEVFLSSLNICYDNTDIMINLLDLATEMQ